MNNLKFVEKVMMSCKTIEQLEVAAAWGYRTIPTYTVASIKKHQSIDKTYNDMSLYLISRSDEIKEAQGLLC
ncbi:MAG: hypothetical protein ACTSU6_04830 [Candidatus Njordarchaeales archaeon]